MKMQIGVLSCIYSNGTLYIELDGNYPPLNLGVNENFNYSMYADH